VPESGTHKSIDCLRGGECALAGCRPSSVQTKQCRCNVDVNMQHMQEWEGVKLCLLLTTIHVGAINKALHLVNLVPRVVRHQPRTKVRRPLISRCYLEAYVRDYREIPAWHMG